MTDELLGRVERWLGDQGYPLEMRVAAAFEQRGFRVIQSDFYEDPKSGDQREIDVMASIQRNLGKAVVRLTMMIECKASRDKPWVVFTSSSIKYAAPATVAQRAGSARASWLLDQLAKRKEVQRLALFKLPERPAYGVTQAFANNADVAYAACMSAANAVAGHAALDSHYDSRGWPMIEILLPVVVIDGFLFEAYLGADTQVVVNRVPRAVLAWRNPIVGMPTTFIDIATVASLPALVDDARAAAMLLLGMKSELEEAIAQPL